jgi:hypothetical protein
VLPLLLDWTNLLVLYYIGLFAFIVSKSTFCKGPGLGRKLMLSVFGLKMALGISYGYVCYYLIPAHDTFLYFKDGETVYHTLGEDPLKYLRLVFGPNNVEMSDDWTMVIRRIHLHWKITSSYMMVRLNAVFMLFSFGNYLVHAVFVSFLSFIGLTAIYKAVVAATRVKSRFLPVATFLIPSTLFWASGMHKDGVVLFWVGIAFWNLIRFLEKGRAWQMVWTAVALSMIYLIREYLFLMLLPGLIAYVWTHYQPHRPMLKFLITYVCLIAGGLLLPHVTSLPDPLHRIVHAQEEVLRIFKGDSDFEIAVLSPNLGSFLRNAPDALINVLVRPFPTEIAGAFHLFSLIESWLILALLFLAGVRGRFSISAISRQVALFLITAFSYMVLIGLLFPNLGTISRYRSTALVFLVIGIALMISRNRLQKN